MSAPTNSPELRDPLFKGCTRPPMLFGVPMVPLAAVCGAVIILSVWTSFLLLGLLVPLILTMRQMTKSDDQQFRLTGLKLLFRLVNYNHNGKFWKASAYSPFAFTKRR